MIYKEWLALLATALTLLSFYPYIRSIMRKETKPHVFSWVIWGVTTCLVFAAQLSGGGGIGAWPTAVSGLISLGIAMLAYRCKSDVRITRLDWICLMGAFASMGIWIFTADPLWAVIVLTVIDTLGFLPTIRKAYHQPFEENMTMYVIVFFRNLIGMLALETYSTTTLLFPAVMSLTIVIAVPLILFRRWQAPNATSKHMIPNSDSLSALCRRISRHLRRIFS
jgi:hypothetical protein